MQNKPKLQRSQMNVNKVLTKDYEKKTLGERGKNKPKTNPKQTQTNPNKAKTNPNKSKIPRGPNFHPVSPAFFAFYAPYAMV